MHIVFFIGSMIKGGAEQVISILANELSQRGWNVEIGLLLKNEVVKERYPLNENIKIVDLTAGDGSYFSRATKWIRKIRNYVQNNEFDYVISFVGRINALVLTSLWGLRTPIIVSERNDPVHDGRSRLMLRYCNYVYRRRAKYVVFQTQYEQKCFSKSLFRKSVIIENPVKTTGVHWIYSDQKLIVSAGRLNEQKNYDLLIRAVYEMKLKGCVVKCIIYGEGEKRQHLEDMINQLDLNEEIELPGNRVNVTQYYRNASAFVQTSFFEGQSNALIEALMMGVPCISTTYPGIEEVIIDGINGALVDNPTPSVLADKIIEVIENREMSEKLSCTGIASASKYDIDNVVDKWLKLF